jgi:hypothetical protein
MSGLTDVDIKRMRDQLFLEGPERKAPTEPLLAAAATGGSDCVCQSGQRLNGHRDRGHDRRPLDDPDPRDRAGGPGQSTRIGSTTPMSGKANCRQRPTGGPLMQAGP